MSHEAYEFNLPNLGLTYRKTFYSDRHSTLMRKVREDQNLSKAISVILSLCINIMFPVVTTLFNFVMEWLHCFFLLLLAVFKSFICSPMWSWLKAKKQCLLVSSDSPQKPDEMQPDVEFISRNSALARYLKENMRYLNSPFQPPWVMWSGHVETILPRVLPSTFCDFGREYLELEDGGVIALDWAKDSSHAARLVEYSPVLLMVFCFSDPPDCYNHLCVRALRRGLRPCVIRLRGSPATHLTTPVIPSWADPTDLRESIQYITAKHPDAHIGLLGSSIGSAYVLSYLGEYGSSCLISAAVCISPIFQDLKSALSSMHSIYSNTFLKTLKQSILQHEKQFSSKLNISEIRSARDPVSVINAIFRRETAFVGTPDIWEALNPLKDVDEISIPVLFINSKNDPISSAEFIPKELIEAYPNFFQVVTDFGGHAGYVHKFGSCPWSHELSLDYIKTVLYFIMKEEAGDVHRGPSAAVGRRKVSLRERSRPKVLPPHIDRSVSWRPPSLSM